MDTGTFSLSEYTVFDWRKTSSCWNRLAPPSRHLAIVMAKRRSCHGTTEAGTYYLLLDEEGTSDEDVSGPSSTVSGEIFKRDRFCAWEMEFAVLQLLLLVPRMGTPTTTMSIW